MVQSAKPGRIVLLAFAVVIAIGTVVLSLPISSASGERTDWLAALFTATSATCVTGLVVLDNELHWSRFGQISILILIQIGGLGIMTVATLFAAFFSRNMGLRTRLIAQTERNSASPADIRRLLKRVVIFSLGFEAVAAVVMIVRFATFYKEPLGHAIYSGIFHAVSAFNNAGFGIYSDNLVRYVGDGWVLMTVSLSIILGGLGFPVVFEVARAWRRPREWSIVTKITLPVTAALLILPTIAIMLFEYANPKTLGALSGGQFVTAAFFTAVQPRTAGFNAIDLASLHPETLLLSDGLMFIGGGSAGTAGGIKVTTFGLLAFVLWAEIRGMPDVEVGRRRVPDASQRQAVAVALLGIALVAIGTAALLVITHHELGVVLFEVLSAFGTVGLSVGITPTLPPAAQVVLIMLMYAGRLGPLTFASAMALRESALPRRLPEERITLG